MDGKLWRINMEGKWGITFYGKQNMDGKIWVNVFVLINVYERDLC